MKSRSAPLCGKAGENTGPKTLKTRKHVSECTFVIFAEKVHCAPCFRPAGYRLLPRVVARGSASRYIASQLQRKGCPLKTATLPSLRVEPELRDAAESVLQAGETLSGFIETSVRETIERRRTRIEFIARGMVSRDEAKRTGVTFAADQVHAELGQMLVKAKAKGRKRAGG